MYEVSIKTSFSAAHHLRGYQGSCESPHGHNWDVEVWVRGSCLDDVGMLVDFRVLRGWVNEVIAELDHKDLNVVSALGGRNPTSENLAAYLHGQITARLKDARLRVHRVRVHETRGAAASYWEGDAPDD